MAHTAVKQTSRIPGGIQLPFPGIPKENPFTTSIKPPNKQIWINTNSFRLFRLAFTFRWFGITCFGRFRSRIPGREIPSAAATSMRVPEVNEPLIPTELLYLPGNEGGKYRGVVSEEQGGMFKQKL
ncbi:hypothetical protein NQZ68_025989 [Dissostichus eleginoides]|nr:hypothetical protein NQZ68_025989 [Dissostichus eleginoides]